MFKILSCFRWFFKLWENISEVNPGIENQDVLLLDEKWERINFNIKNVLYELIFQQICLMTNKIN